MLRRCTRIVPSAVPIACEISFRARPSASWATISASAGVSGSILRNADLDIELRSVGSLTISAIAGGSTPSAPLRTARNPNGTIDDFGVAQGPISDLVANGIAVTNTIPGRTLSSNLLAFVTPASNTVEVVVGVLDITNGTGDDSEVKVTFNLGANLIPGGNNAFLRPPRGKSCSMAFNPPAA